MVKAHWEAISASVRGASHERTGQGNQDAVRFRHALEGDNTLILAVADGHGSTRSFRSDRGSALAVECALREMRRLVRRLGWNAPISRVRNQARQRWPRTMIEAWKAAVRADLVQHPFTQMEFAAFPEKPPALKRGEDLPVTAYLAYGATLVTVAITPHYIIYTQLGDGDILTVQADGNVSRPLPRLHEFLAHQTTSLCSYDAVTEFQVRVVPVRGAAPAMVMLSTDGYANCFGDDEDFFKVGIDFLSYLRTEGVQFVGEKLEEWLHESSHDGSGDDITVGMAVRPGAFRNLPAPVEPVEVA